MKLLPLYLTPKNTLAGWCVCPREADSKHLKHLQGGAWFY